MPKQKKFRRREEPPASPWEKRAPQLQQPKPKFSPITLQPTPPKLVDLLKDLHNPDKRLIFVDGLPSTGKTKSCIETGIKLVSRGQYEKLIIVRPVIEPEFGLLPGTLLEKMAPYVRQSGAYVDRQGYRFEEMVQRGQIEVLAADLLQGNRFQNCFVVFDEAQNVPKSKAFQYLSRVGENCKYVLIGDTSTGQMNDRIKKDSMLHYCMGKFADEPWAAIHSFHDEADVLGDDITKKIILKLMPDFVL